MSLPRLLTLLGGLPNTALPSLRVIGMAYIGVIGVAAAALVVAVGVAPVAPVQQPPAPPARPVAGGIVMPGSRVQPALEIVVRVPGKRGVAPEAAFPFLPPPRVAAAAKTSAHGAR